MTPILWHRDPAADDAPRHAQFDAPLWTDGAGPPAWVPMDAAHMGRALMLSSIEPLGHVVAVALIPESLDRVVRHNRIPAASGMLTLRHADRIDIANHTFWIAVGNEPELTEYSPGKHNTDVYCFLTKARLKEGESIAVCPGTPTTSCGTIYKLSAWQAMLTQPGFRCASCGFDPTQPAWRPPSQRPAKRIDAVFELLRQGADK